MALIIEFSQNVKTILERPSRKLKAKMKNTLIQSIKKLKRQKQMTDRNSDSKAHNTGSSAPKRTANSSHAPSRKDYNPNKSIFQGYSFCFPLADQEISPTQVQLLSESIEIEGGRVFKFVEKHIAQEVDFMMINPKTLPDVVFAKLRGLVNFKEMLDYHFIEDSLKQGTLQDYQKYSLYVNTGQSFDSIENIPSRMKSEEPSIWGHKKVKRESDDETVKLEDDIEEEELEFRPIMNEQRPQRKMKEQDDFHTGRQEIQDIMLTHKNIGGDNYSINKYIADQLTKLMKIYANERDIGRKIAYMKAAAVIRNLDKEIESERDVENIKGIGKKISDKIKELLGTGKISKLQKLKGSDKNIILAQFSQIWGIGPSKAQQLYQLGLKTVPDLRKRTDLLTKNQKLGLKYHEQFESKIPRQKVTKMFDFIKTVMMKLVPSLEMYNFEVCGSYRRGKATCGDMDIIISRKDGTYEKTLLADLVKELERARFLTDHLTTPKASDTRSSISYMGVCQFEDETHHRIDMKYYPIEEFAFAILYFTGSGTFNRMMRLHCMKLGLNLSDHGAIPKRQKDVIWTRPIPKCYTERDIFDFLEFKYKTPQERDL